MTVRGAILQLSGEFGARGWELLVLEKQMKWNHWLETTQLW
jgi:hypothetical protein